MGAAKYRWNHQAFGRVVGQVETAEEIKSCPVGLDTLVACGMVGKTQSKKEKDDDKESDARVRSRS